MISESISENSIVIEIANMKVGKSNYWQCMKLLILYLFDN